MIIFVPIPPVTSIFFRRLNYGKIVSRQSMFGQLNARRTRHQDQWVSISILVHCLILTWLLHSPKPVFVAPSYVMKGQPGGALTRLYFGGATGVTQEQSSHLSLPKTASTNSHRTPPILSKAK